MKKDLQYYNRKWWYRLLKVIFILLFVLSVLGVGIVAYSQNKPYVQHDYTVQCNYGERVKFTAFKDKNINIPPYIASDGSNIGQMPDSVKAQIQNACGLTDDDLSKILNSLWDDLSAGKTLNNAPLWTVRSIDYTIGTQEKAIAYVILALVPVILAFEIIRIVFYYILVGEFFPTGPKKYYSHAFWKSKVTKKK